MEILNTFGNFIHGLVAFLQNFKCLFQVTVVFRQGTVHSSELEAVTCWFPHTAAAFLKKKHRYHNKLLIAETR